LPIACSEIAKTGAIEEFIDVLQTLLDAVTTHDAQEPTPIS